MAQLPATTDPNPFVDKLRDRIRSTLGELISDEQWDKLMREEVDRFFNPRTEGHSGYHQTRVPSDFTTIVQSAIAYDVKARVARYLENDPGWQQKWTPEGAEIPAKLDAMIEANLPVLLRECVAAFFVGFAGRTSESALMSLERRMRG